MYSENILLILKEEAEIAECMSILHNMTHIRYQRYSSYINLPIIIISSFVGFFSILQMFEYQNIVIGIISIFMSFLKSIDEYYKITKLSETHRLYSLSYYKIHENIKIQLSLPHGHRQNIQEFLNLIKITINNLKESEPTIQRNIIKMFNHKYKNYTNKKPNICNGLSKIIISELETINSTDVFNNQEKSKDDNNASELVNNPDK
jgi:hypothetical protein